MRRARQLITNVLARVRYLGRHDVSRPGEERALRFCAMMLLLQRTSYLVPTSLDAVRTGTIYRSSAVNVAMVAMAVAWNVAIAVSVRRRGWFPRWAVAGDVVVVCVLLVVGTLNALPDDVFGHLNWSVKLVMATAALAGAALAPRWIVPAVLLPLGVNYATAVVRFGEMLPLDGPLEALNSYFWYALIAYVMRRYLCAQGRALDEATRRRVELEGRRATDRARYTERIAQYRRLHDTVLATLTAIARGGLDHRADAVRSRCAAEADYVRRLVSEYDVEPDTPISTRLGAVADELGSLGLRVHYLYDGLPAELPGPVVDGIAEATREALNNVLTHSGAGEAWLTATGDDGTLLVRIVDRGRGFDPNTRSAGFGVRRSITERMREAGGLATVTGMPGAGVCVELTWPADQRRR
jgi:signal transduction histidine kinase